MNGKAFAGFEEDLRLILLYQESVQKVYPMLFDLPEPNSGFGNVYLRVLGWGLDFNKGADRQCFFSGACSCSGVGEITVSCPCGETITCYTVEVGFAIRTSKATDLIVVKRIDVLEAVTKSLNLKLKEASLR